MKRGMGEIQFKMIETAKQKILEALKNGEWHKYGEIQKTTGLSTATLSKRLKDLEGIVERKLDKDSEEYPPPVYYRIKPSITQSEWFKVFKDFLKEDFEFWVVQKRNIGYFLQYLTVQLNLAVIGALRDYLGDSNFEAFNQTLDSLIISWFRDSILKLAETLPQLSKDKRLLHQILNGVEKGVLEDFDLICKKWRKVKGVKP